MFVHDRKAAILKQLSHRPRMGILELQRSMKVSRSTLRRDLLDLEERGEIFRVHGGVVHHEYLHGEPTFDRRGKQAVEAKRSIAASAASLVKENAIVYIDAGTTCLEVGRRLLLRSDLKIFTHSLSLAAEALATERAASVVVIGGEIRRVSQAVVGALSLGWLKHLQFDIAILGASGLDEDGLSTTEISEASMKQAIIARSKRVVVAADAEKWNSPAAVRFSDWKKGYVWVVDSKLPRAVHSTLRQRGLGVIKA